MLTYTGNQTGISCTLSFALPGDIPLYFLHLTSKWQWHFITNPNDIPIHFLFPLLIQMKVHISLN